ncbi:MAG TPA: Ig-like domain-containing protein [Polyangia bacterium]|jgi:hypothetical protein|nr:Ig-like domain-containing protein [Polyangia bacterium]
MSTRRGNIGTVVVALSAIAIVVVATRVSRRLFESPETGVRSGDQQSAVAAPTAPPLPGDDVEVMSATGKVEAQRGDGWAPIRQGDKLTRSDIVRTSAASGAVLRLGAGTEIELRAGVEIRLDAWTAGGPTAAADGAAPNAAAANAPGAAPGSRQAGASVDLRRGKVLARVGNTGALSIHARDTQTTSEGPARFVVLADENGRVAVATISGKTRFAAGGKTISLPAGTASSSQNGGPPEDPEHISEDVFLNVAWPTVDRRGEHAEIKGRATPSSVVTVRAPSGLETATVGANGQFSVTVPVGVGKTPIEVEAEDLVGHTKQATTTLTRRPPPPPALTPEATDLWKKQGDK